MKVRQIVTGHDDTGKSIFLADEQVSPVEVAAIPGFKTFELWSTEGSRKVPHQGPLPGVPNYFPSLNGSVFRIISFPPQPQGEDFAVETSEADIAEIKSKMPGLIEHLELDEPGMHTTDSVDFGIVLQGEICLTLDDGAERYLKAGDCVVQNGTRHAWNNRTSKPTVMAFILQGAERC